MHHPGDILSLIAILCQLLLATQYHLRRAWPPAPLAGPVVLSQWPLPKVDPILRMLLARNEGSLQESGQPLNLTKPEEDDAH
jgi:hypothetical protein